MENVVNVYLRMTLVGTILILSVLAMRPIIKKYSNRMVCCLWAVVLFRLLCPITSGIGLIPLPEIAKGKDVIENEAYIEDMHTEIVHAENAYAENADTVDAYTRNLEAINPDTMDLVATDFVVKTEQNEPKQSMVEQAVTNLPVTQETATKEALAKENAVEENVTKLTVGKEAVNEMTTKEESVTAPTYATDTMIEKAPVSQKIMDPTSIIFGIWMVGALLVLAVGIRKYFQLNKGLREAIPYGTHGKYKVRKCSIPESPMSFGIFHPIIYVPLSFGENEEGEPALERQQEMILTHEQMHLKHHDPLWKALVFVALAVYWWNPVVWIYARCLNKDLEMACDENVLKCIGKECKKVYATTLLDFATRQSGISLMAGFGESNAEKRIENILKYKEKPIWLSVLLIICMISMGGCFALADTTDLGHDGDMDNDKMEMTVSDGDAWITQNDETVSDGDGIEKNGNEINLMDLEKISSVSDGDALEESTLNEDVKITLDENSKFLSAEGTDVLLVENAEQNLRLFGTLQNSEAEVYTLQVGDKIYDLKNRYNNSNYILGDIFRLCFDLHFYSIYTCNVDDDEKLEYVILPDYAWGYNDAFIIDIDNNDKAMVYNYSYNLWENCGQIDQEYPRYSDYEIRDPQEYYVGEDNQLHFRFTFVNKNNPIEIMKYWGGTVRFEALEDDYCTFIVSATGEEPVFTDKEKQILKEDVLNENRCDNVYKLAKEMQKDVYLYGAQKDEQCYSILRMGEHAYALDFDWKQYKDIQIYTNDYDEDGCMEVAMDCFKEPYGLGGEELYVVELKENATEIYKCPSVTIGQLSESANKCSKEGLLVTDEYNRFAANGTFLEFFFYMNVDMNCRTEMHSSGTYIGEIKYHEDGSFEYIERPNGDVLMLLYG